MGGRLSCHCIVDLEFHTMYKYCSSEQGKQVRPSPFHAMLHQAGVSGSEVIDGKADLSEQKSTVGLDPEN